MVLCSPCFCESFPAVEIHDCALLSALWKWIVFFIKAYKNPDKYLVSVKNFSSSHCFFTTAFTSPEAMLMFPQYIQPVPHPLSSRLKIKFTFSPLLRGHIILSAPQRELFNSQLDHNAEESASLRVSFFCGWRRNLSHLGSPVSPEWVLTCSW